MADFRAAGARLVAISRMTVEDNRRLAADYKLDFPILSDTDLAFIKRLDMVHTGAGPGGQDVARPATYLLDRTGKVLRRWTASEIRTRPDPNEILEAVKQAR